MIVSHSEFTPILLPHIPEDIYLSDKTAVSSSALRLIRKSEATFRAQYLEAPPEPADTQGQKLGKILHSLAEKGHDHLETLRVMPDFGDFRSSKNRATRDAWIAEQSAGTTIVSAEEKARVEGMYAALLGNDKAHRILLSGASELTGYYVDPETGIKCRIRPDILGLEKAVLGEIKTCRSCEKWAAANAIGEYGYYFQIAMYREGIKQITGVDIGDPVFIFLEKEPPFEIAVYIADEDMLRKGYTEYREALQRLERALKTNTWPVHQKQIETISLPRKYA